MEFEAVIGLEVHAQLATESKLFCGCKTTFGCAPNSNTCPVCLGLPGSLPVVNQRAIEYALRAALATTCRINTQSVFARKNYFYPDLPKGYQISQYDRPLAEHGALSVPSENGESRVRIKRIHLEEDAGKLTHDTQQAGDQSLVDFNRAGVPLIEIVSEPDLHDAAAAAEYLRRWRQLLRYLKICDGNLEEGSLRCDANVSIRTPGEKTLHTKVEIKNINSFRFVQQAIEFEFARQMECRKRGEPILAETRLWDAARGETRPMRSKEEAEDYRYFPEPDLKPLSLEQAFINKVRAELSELPIAKLKRYLAEFGLTYYDANFLTQEVETAAYFEECCRIVGSTRADTVKNVANWMMGDFTKALKDSQQSFAVTKVTPQHLAELLQCIDSGAISGKSAKVVFERVFVSGEKPAAAIAALGLTQISDDQALHKLVSDVLAAHAKEVADYRQGRSKLFGFFVGQVMKASKGQAHPTKVNELLRELLK
jgi:aspartyl-tRNA(Asn)/glutamyl-tRNA(Gln) amidotransferase subunit B